ncbi:MAG: hypothetical protein JSS63_04665 [Bacteroidetes bacterium]|nr:hypothetical protein [Bacteroidota bacterium]
MKSLIIFFLFLLTAKVFPQDTYTIYEKGEEKICGKIIRVDGIWIDNGRMKADISILANQNSKPITGGYKMGDTIDIKKGCKYFVKLIQKFGIKDDLSGFVELSKNADLSDYIDFALGNLRLNDGFYIGSTNYKVTRISKDEAEITQAATKTTAAKTITLKKNDIIWKGFEAYYISDFLANASDKIEQQWTIEIKPVKDYSIIVTVIPGELMNAPKDDFPIGSEELIIRKMKYYPKQKFVQEEYDKIPVKYWVLKVYYYPGGIARQMIEVERNGKKSMLEFDAYKSFDTEEEVLEFAKVNGITDIKLEETR